MKEDNEFKKTEQFALEAEMKEQKWQQDYGTLISEQINKMDELLKDGSEAARWKLHSMFLDKNFFEPFKQTDEIATMYVIMNIFEDEKKYGMQCTILDQVDNVEELLNYFMQIKFSLFRLDFDIGKDTQQQFITLIKRKNVTTCMLEVLLSAVAMRPLLLSLKLEKIFSYHKMYGYRLAILNYIENRWPGSYNVNISLAEIYEKAKHQLIAQEYKNKLPNINSYSQEQKIMILNLQELLWILYYEHHDVKQELASYISKWDIPDEIWIFLLTKRNQAKVEYYILLVEVLLDIGAEHKVWITLEYINQIHPGNEMVLCLMANICFGNNQIDIALKYLMNINMPSNMVKEFINVCERKLSEESNG